MKKQYTEPEMEVIGLGREDIILTSAIDCDDALCDEEEIPCGCHGKPGEER
ncbi:MAG: hypothetical protein II000_07985 [Clostridia bacterium]|nr:hypothetical protein [Clostridia bacterium]